MIDSVFSWAGYMFLIRCYAKSLEFFDVDKVELYLELFEDVGKPKS